MPRATDAFPKPAVLPPPAVPAPGADDDEGMLDLDEHGQINNQHLEVR